MEPLSAVAASVGIANGVTSLGKVAGGGVASAFQRLRLSGTLDFQWLELEILAQSSNRFTIAETNEVHEFLGSDFVKPILSLLAIGILLPPSVEADEVVDSARITFLDECKRWTIKSGGKWAKKAESVFASLIALFRGALPTGADSSELTDAIKGFSDFLTTPLKVGDNTGQNKEYLFRLISLAGDIKSLRRTSELSNNLATSIRAGEHSAIIGHAEVDDPVSFDDLYVSRGFVDNISGESEESDNLISSGEPFRVVLAGSPGAGKSTFVKFLTGSMANPEVREIPLPSAVIRCKNYAGSGWSGTISQYAALELNSELQTGVSPEDFENLLLTGKILIVFDGLDEITDLPMRQEMVRRLQRFSARYPALSRLITTREVGYSHASLNANIFRHVKLQEFSIGQIEEYCTRWFRKNDRSHLVTHFIAESQAVSDLRSNPLLLSLLCILYRDSGAIPANRRGIYRECAQLLFHKWDSHRQIRQHEVMPDYGDLLMQEIAQWTYKSVSAQVGLEEQVIVKSLSTYMVTDLGFMAINAEKAAADFLNFCAGRAWLLGVTGTSKYGGQRIFAFTHRTFYEFFAAEAFAREAATADDLARILKEAYVRDSTSVLPELLIQSFDQTRRRGATDVFDSLAKSGTNSTLLLRLMDGANLAPHVRTKGFDSILRSWDGGIEPESFTALLSISGPARDHFYSDYLKPAWRNSDRRKFLYGWASLQLSGFGERFIKAWSPVLNDITMSYSEEIHDLKDPIIKNWLVGAGRPAKNMKIVWDSFVCFGVYGWVPGVLWWNIEAIFTGAAEYEVDSTVSDYMSMLESEIENGSGIPVQVLRRFVESIEPLQPENAVWTAGRTKCSPHDSARNILAYLALALSETGGIYSNFFEIVSDCWDGQLSSAVRVRRGILNQGTQVWWLSVVRGEFWFRVLE